MNVFSFIVAILPVILIGLYIYRKDREKESSKLLFKLFIYGILSCFPTILLGLIIASFFPAMEDMNFIQLFLYVFISIALVEEICKWFFLYKGAYNHSEFDTLYDMIVYASFVALGFACFENVLYVSDTGILVGLYRSITAVPGHVCDGILMGYYLGLSKIYLIKGNKKESRKHKVLSILVPIITHGIYDFCLFSNNSIFILLFVVFIIILFSACYKKIKKISLNDIRFKYRNNYCTFCGTIVNSNYCPMCGKKNI